MSFHFIYIQDISKKGIHLTVFETELKLTSFQLVFNSPVPVPVFPVSAYLPQMDGYTTNSL